MKRQAPSIVSFFPVLSEREQRSIECIRDRGGEEEAGRGGMLSSASRAGRSILEKRQLVG